MTNRYRPRTDGPDWRSAFTNPQFREITEKCGCRWRVEASDFEATIYSIERTDPDLGELFTVIKMVANGPLDRVPFDVIRQVCEAVNLPPDIFKVQH